MPRGPRVFVHCARAPLTRERTILRNIAALGALVWVAFLATGALAQSTLDSSEYYIQDDDGCWFTEGPTCVAHESFWDDMAWAGDEYEQDEPDFISRYRNDCGLRVLLKVCHQANNSIWKGHEEAIAAYPALARSECEAFVVEADEVEVMLTSYRNEPTGRAEFRWIGSTIADNDEVCADKSGVNEWWPDW